VLGAVSLAAAVGIYRGQAWGRALGIGVAAIDLALVVFRAAGSSPPDSIVDVALSSVLDVIVLWVLVGQWRALD
jgi:hypothetical protein